MKQFLSKAAVMTCLVMCLSSCDWYYFSESEEEPSSEQKETRTTGSYQVSVTPDEQERASGEDLKHAMKASARYIKNLEAAMENGNWSAARVSAKKLEDLIGQRCVNLYIKTYGSAPEEFVMISQDFYEEVLKFLMAERYDKYDAARDHFDGMKADCDNCHSRFRKERG